MTNIRQDKFKIGDRVTWADENYADMTNAAKTYGEGPFSIVEVQNPEFESYEHYHDYEGGSNWRSMGHTQFVKIDAAPEKRWSGAFFKIAA